MDSISPVSAKLHGFSSNLGFFTFVVEEQEIQIETRFLLPCNYFNTLINSNMKESFSRRINITEESKEAVDIFVNFLKTFQLPSLDLTEACELYQIAHRYDHEALLSNLRTTIIKQAPTNLGYILYFGCFYKDQAIIKACRDHATINRNDNLIFKLIEFSNDDCLEEVFKWPRESIYYMFTYKEKTYYNSSEATPFSKLVDQKKYSMAARFLQAANSVGVGTSSILSNPTEIILQLLQLNVSTKEEKESQKQGKPPSEEQKQLILSVAEQNPGCLIDSYKENIPIFLVLNEGWNEIFEDMLKICTERVFYAKNSNQETLISIAISKKMIVVLQALRTKPHNLGFNEFTDYLLKTINFKYFAGIKELLKFKVNIPYREPLVNIRCVNAAIEIKDVKILQIIWPYFKVNETEREVAALRISAFEQNQLDLASILFSGTFDSSKDQYGYFPWIHQVIEKGGSIEWIAFMARMCTDKNVTIRLEVSSSYYHSNTSPLVTPFLRAIARKRDQEEIIKLLELGFDMDKGNELHCPLHLIFEYNSPRLLKKFLSYNPNLSVLNNKGENFFHLYFNVDKEILTLDEFRSLALKDDKKALEQKSKAGLLPLHLALSIGRYDEAFYMVMMNPDILWIPAENQICPLQSMQGNKFEKIMNRFIELATANTNEEIAAVLLYWCAENYLHAYCERLFPTIKDIKSVIRHEKNLLHLAVEGGMCETVTKLVKLGVSINSRDAHKRTALHLAVLNIDLPMVELMLSLKIDESLIDQNRETALSLALKHYKHPRTQEMRKIIRLLEDKSCHVQ